MARVTSNELGGAFSRFERSAFRLETLDRYTVPNEAEPLRRFLAGEAQDDAWREPWTSFVRAAAADGKSMSRVHVLDEPLNDYLRFEITSAYPANVQAGEAVRILRRQEWPALEIPGHDFWLFDDREAAVMIYGDAGEFLGAKVTTDPTAIRDYCRARERLVRHSVDLSNYVTQR